MEFNFFPTNISKLFFEEARYIDKFFIDHHMEIYNICLFVLL